MSAGVVSIAINIYPVQQTSTVHQNLYPSLQNANFPILWIKSGISSLKLVRLGRDSINYERPEGEFSKTSLCGVIAIDKCIIHVLDPTCVCLAGNYEP